MKKLLVATTISILFAPCSSGSNLPMAKPASAPVAPATSAPKQSSRSVQHKKSSAGGSQKEPPPGSNLVINGSFEISPPVGHGWKHLDAGNTDIYGWQVLSGNVDLFEGMPTPDGTKTVDLNGQEPGVIRQAIKTRPGSKYRVKLLAGGHPMGGGKVKILILRAAGQQQSWMFENDKFVHGDNPGFREFQWDFTAREPITTLEVGSLNEGGGGPVVDSVSVVKIGKGGPITASNPPLPAGTPSLSQPPAKATNLIVNGSFENSVDPGGGWKHYDAGNAAAYGWHVASGEVDLWGGIKTPFGKKTIDLDGQRAGSVMQSVPTEQGATYRVKFWVGSYDDRSKNVFVRAAGKRLVWPISVSGSTEQPCLREFTFDFKARDKVTAIEIGSATEGTQGPVLDNVSCLKVAEADLQPAKSQPSAFTAPPMPVSPPLPQSDTSSIPEDAQSSENASAQPSSATTIQTPSIPVAAPVQPAAARPVHSAEPSEPAATENQPATTGNAGADSSDAEETPAQRKARRKAEEQAQKEALRRQREEIKSGGYYSGLGSGNGK